jgi:predicted anti-sigma-YlaC factor YlaD
MIDCSQSSQLSSLFDGELNVSARAALEAHLQTCDTCQQLLRQMQGLSVLLDAHPQPRLAMPMLQRMHWRLSGMMEQEAQLQRLRGRLLRISHVLSGIAACVLLAGGVWLYQGREPARPGTSVSVLTETPKPPDPWETQVVGETDPANSSLTSLSSMDSGTTLSVGGLLAPTASDEQQ